MTEKQKHILDRDEIYVLQAPIDKLMKVVEAARKYAIDEPEHFGCACAGCQLRQTVEDYDGHYKQLQSESVGFDTDFRE